jgi:predicted glycogen debranching enzyme
MHDEYLLTNQLGGYCSSTFKNGNTRKYHGLLIASDHKLSRQLIVASLYECITSDQKYYLHTFTYKPGVRVPDGSQYLRSSVLGNKQVQFNYELPGIQIKKEISLAQEHNSVTVKYHIKSEQRLQFDIAPMLTKRSIHGLKQYRDDFKFDIKKHLNNIEVELGPEEDLSIKVLTFNPKSLLNVNYDIDLKQIVYNNFEYQVELLRGLTANEDLVKLGEISFNLDEGDNYITLQLSYENSRQKTTFKQPDALKPILEEEVSYARMPVLKQFKTFLLKHAYDFLIEQGSYKSIIAGYHWFGDWGRDTFISFRGLVLVPKRYKFGKALLDFWASKIKNGLIPNEMNGPSYNSIDASLWFIIAVYYYYLETKDPQVLDLADEINNIVSEFIQGTEYEIGLNNKGYLTWKDEKVSLSWMDSNYEGNSLSGRKGYLIEIQMLWYNALKVLEFFDVELNKTCITPKLKALIKQLHKNINLDYWDNNQKYLFDFIKGKEKSDSIRPNAIIGLALPFKIFNTTRAKQILKTAEKELLTDVGLYSLAPKDKGFINRYKGNMAQRDKAYHNGAIWPFLLGFYLKAIQNYYGKDADAIVKTRLSSFYEIITNMGLNYLPELFDPGDLDAEGALSQAWNYALFLEVINDLDK